MFKARMPDNTTNAGWAVEDVRQRRKHADNGRNVAEAMINGTCRAVCDGSYKDGHGTASFCLHGDNVRQQIQGSNRTPGRPIEQSPHRSELGGIVGTLTVAKAICEEHSITSGSMELAVDCESAIKAVTAADPPKAKAAHYDMITECRHLITSLPIQVKIRWIESHQDTKSKRLDWWARQNVNMDLSAKRHWRKYESSPRGPHKLQCEKIAISVRGQKLSCFSKKDVHELVCEQRLRDFWAEKDDLTEQGFSDVCWEAADKSHKEHSRGQRRWFAKHATRWCGVARMRKIRREWDHNKCPLCGRKVETTVHMMKCKHAGATGTWTEGLERLDEELQKRHTEPHLRTQIMAHLRHWRDDTPYTMEPQISYQLQELERALQAQSRIGWYNFQLGRVSKAMVACQQACYNRNDGDSGKTGLRWTVAIINKMKATAWDMWEHRNSILHGESEDYHTRRRTRQVDKAIKRQFKDGKTELLRRHKHLLRSKRAVLQMDLINKERWLEAVQGARRAWQDAQDSMPNLEDQREGMRNWIRTGRCSGTTTLPSEGNN